MAGLGAKLWIAGDEVTAALMNGYLQDQVIMVFANEAARTAAFGGAGEPTLAEGMFSYLSDIDQLQYYDGSSWKQASGGADILQVQVFS